MSSGITLKPLPHTLGAGLSQLVTMEFLFLAHKQPNQSQGAIQGGEQRVGCGAAGLVFLGQTDAKAQVTSGEAQKLRFGDHV